MKGHPERVELAARDISPPHLNVCYMSEACEGYFGLGKRKTGNYEFDEGLFIFFRFFILFLGFEPVDVCGHIHQPVNQSLPLYRMF